jgi:hypothetical protein
MLRTDDTTITYIPAIDKSFHIMRSAEHIWHQNGKESTARAIRFTTMVLHLSSDDYRKGFDNV